MIKILEKAGILNFPKLNGKMISVPALVGPRGVTFIPHVDEEGNLTWTNDKDFENPEPSNIQGKQGIPGITPVRGEDYWTAQDKQEIINDVLLSLPDGDEVDY